MLHGDIEGRRKRQAPSAPIPGSAVTGVILAGGRGRRMGGLDKGLIGFAGRPLVQWVIDSLAPQVGSIMISANRNRDVYARYGLEVVSDPEPSYKGPLAGVLSAMRAARTDWILTVPCDGPFLPGDLLTRLTKAMSTGDAEMAVAATGGRIQPVYSLQPVTLSSELAAFIAEGSYRAAQWIGRHRCALADFSHQQQGFANVNSHEDLERLARTLGLPVNAPSSD
ncbi:MAG: molybdenum cofactor guanylyltransferase [Thiocapsa sp.]|nr:molybdenum cofactor guanylyltransferase MobA [Thiocapsa sp.]MCG6896168.1 molybdenum cofactor guanylyltransferase [Thiocapsa sp.]